MPHNFEFLLNELEEQKKQHFENAKDVAMLDDCKKMLLQNPQNPETLKNIALFLKKIGAANLALNFLDIASELNPKDSVIDRIIGDIYFFCKEDYRIALSHYEDCIEKDPQNYVVINMIGHLYGRIDKYQNVPTQIEYFKRALEIKPDNATTIRNLALTYPNIGEYDKSIEYFHKLFKFQPVMDDYFAYACLKIQLKNFDEGWKYYESRFKKQYGRPDYPEFTQPKWEGEAIPDKTLLVQYEQGFGDTIQFFRYLEQVKPLVKKIIFRIQDSLVDLMRLNADGIEIVGMSKPPDSLEFDYHVALMSLPFLLHAQADNIPLSQGYLKADEKKVKEFKEKYFNNDSFKIGITFNGMALGNPYRNVPLKHFLPLTKIEGVKVYSFQKDTGVNQLKNLGEESGIVDMGQHFNDFSDTAAAMENMDLYVTSDNGVFNLAAAMGKKTFLLLNKHSEWRWFFDDENTPWYDSVKIFKKENESDSWDFPVQKIVEEIKNLI